MDKYVCHLVVYIHLVIGCGTFSRVTINDAEMQRLIVVHRTIVLCSIIHITINH